MESSNSKCSVQDIVLSVMKMGNIVSSNRTHISCLPGQCATMTPGRLPDVTTLPMCTCLCSSCLRGQCRFLHYLTRGKKTACKCNCSSWRMKAKIHLCVTYAVCKYVTFSTFNMLNMFVAVHWRRQVNLIVIKLYLDAIIRNSNLPPSLCNSNGYA